jgi:outer membrane immunogenic protein
MQRQLLGSTAVISIATCLSGPVAAADLPRVYKAPPAVFAPACMWCGFYIGGHAGWGSADLSATPHEGELGDGIASHSADGLVWGMHAGYNWQFANTWVLGIEVDGSGANIDGLSRFSNNPERVFKTNTDVLASLRARLGLAFGRSLIYATGGLAYTKGTFVGISPDNTQTLGKFSKWGSVWGGGIEWKGAPNFSVRLEGLWYHFDDKQPIYGSANTQQETFEPAGVATLKDVGVVRVGASWHFGP